MSITVKSNEGNFTPAPDGLHHAVCVDVVDRGDIETKYGVRRMIDIWWQIDEINPDNHKRYGVRRRFGASLHQKSTLRQMLETWRGRKFTADELMGFDLEKLIGVNCQIQVVQEQGDDGAMYANVKAVVPAPRGAETMVPVDHVRIKDRPPRDAAPAPAASKLAIADEDEVPF